MFLRYPECCSLVDTVGEQPISRPDLCDAHFVLDGQPGERVCFKNDMGVVITIICTQVQGGIVEGEVAFQTVHDVLDVVVHQEVAEDVLPSLDSYCVWGFIAHEGFNEVTAEDWVVFANLLVLTKKKLGTLVVASFVSTFADYRGEHDFQSL